MNPDKGIMLPEEVIVRKIYVIRGLKIMLDMDLADLYGVPTKQLKRAVKRNIERFPEDFMFELTEEELADWRCQFGTSNRERMGIRIRPYAFTEYGVLMLASVLKSPGAIQINILIVRVFSKLRTMLQLNRDLLEKIERLENLHSDHDKKILLLFEYISQFEQSKVDQQAFLERRKIGFIKSE